MSLVVAVIEIARRIRTFVRDLINAAIALVNELATMLKQVIGDLLESIAKVLSDILNVLKKMLLDVLKACKDALKAVLDFATKFIAAFGEFMMILVDILSDPGGWLSGAKNSAYDGAKNHLFNEVKSAVKQWFNDKVKEITGLTEAVWNKLMKGGWTLEKIAKEVWDAIVPQLPFIIGEIVITKVLAKLIPGAGWGAAILEAIQAAIGSLGEILKAIGAVITWLKSVRQGGAGVLFAKAIAAGIVVLLEMAYELLLSGIGKYVSKVGGRLRNVAANLGKDKNATKPKPPPPQGGDEATPPKPQTSTTPPTTRPKDQNAPTTPPKPKDTTAPTAPTKPKDTATQPTKPKTPTTKTDKTEGRPNTPSNNSTRPTPPTSKDKNGNPKNENKDNKPNTRPTPSPKPKTPTPKPNKPDAPDTTKRDTTPDDKTKDQGPDNNKDKTNSDGSSKKDTTDSDIETNKDTKNEKGNRDGKKDTPDKGKDGEKKAPDGKDGNRKPDTRQDRDQKKEDRNEEENSESSKEAQLALIVARIREILQDRLKPGMSFSTHSALLATLRRRYRLTALHKEGGEEFNVIARLNPRLPVIGGYSTYDNRIDHLEPDPPAPKPSGTPARQNGVLASNFRSEGIEKGWAKRRGEKADKARKREPIGFRYINKYDLNADESNFWVRQHLLTELLGGDAGGRNLVPARNRVNQDFKNEVEKHAEQWIDSGKNKFAWYDVQVRYHPGEPKGFPSFLRTEWGGYYPDYNANKWVPEKQGRDYNERSDLEIPPGPGDKVYVNQDTATRIQAMLNISEGIAQDIEDAAEANNEKIPNMASLLQDLKVLRKIKRRQRRSWQKNIRKIIRAASEGHLTFEEKPDV